MKWKQELSLSRLFVRFCASFLSIIYYLVRDFIMADNEEYFSLPPFFSQIASSSLRFMWRGGGGGGKRNSSLQQLTRNLPMFIRFVQVEAISQ